MYKLPQFQVIKSKNQESWVQGRFQLGGGRLGARPSLSDSGGGGASPPPLGFQNLKRKSTVITHTITAIKKETKMKKVKVKAREKKKYIVSGGYDGQRKPLFPPSYISLSPFLPFFL